MGSAQIPIVLSIAGTDPSGGAGIQADIKAISATGAYAASVITAVVAQNTRGVQAVQGLPIDCVRQQLHSVVTDLNVQAVKIGMLHQEQVIEAVFSELRQFKSLPIVLDPVLFATTGSSLLDVKAVSYLKNTMQGVVHLITPNLLEVQHLFGVKIKTAADMESAACFIGKGFSMNVLIKGGHLEAEQSSDVLYLHDEDNYHWFHAPRIETRNTHGTGCSLSSALASYLAQGFSLYAATLAAKSFVSQALLSGARWEIGKGRGPVDHFYFLENRS